MDYKELTIEKLIEKINSYTKISRERDLTEKEQEERDRVRKEYLRRIRANMTGQLEGVVYTGDRKNGCNSKKDN